MRNPAEKNFEAPLSPWTDRERPMLKELSQPYGGQLFEQVSEFYAWYLSWDIAPKAHAKAFELLSRIMRIAQVSKDGGLFLSKDEEQKALNLLSVLREELFNGLCRHQDIPPNLLKMIQLLTIANPKARLVARTNELEYLLCIRAAPSQTVEMKARYQLLLDHILNHVNPKLLDMHAHAVSQGLAKVIENLSSITDIHTAILRATERWL